MTIFSDLRAAVWPPSEEGGTSLTPVYFGFHNGDFDLFDTGQAASAGLEQLAEDGSPAGLAAERLAASPGSQGLVVAGANGPITPGETTEGIISVDGSTNSEVSLAAMILPSNDAFIGTNESIQLFDEMGNFLGAQTLVFEGSDVYDAGTEVNTELDAAFINQMAPNTGIDENGVVTLHPGFNGSAGNPVGDGDQIILGGTDAFGNLIDPTVADFTLPGAQIATIHINTVVQTDLTDANDVFAGAEDDDIVRAGDGNDLVSGGLGWDVIFGGGENDLLAGNQGNDEIYGGDGNDAINGGINRDVLYGGDGHDAIEGNRGFDELRGGDGIDQLLGGLGADVLIGGRNNDFLGGNRGQDEIYGGGGNDEINGGKGDDIIVGNGGFDLLRGGGGEDVFVFTTGDDNDVISDFSDQDSLRLDINGVSDFDAVLAAAIETQDGVLLDFAGQGSVFLQQTELDDLNASQFSFV